MKTILKHIFTALTVVFVLTSLIVTTIPLASAVPVQLGLQKLSSIAWKLTDYIPGQDFPFDTIDLDSITFVITDGSGNILATLTIKKVTLTPKAVILILDAPILKATDLTGAEFSYVTGETTSGLFFARGPAPAWKWWG
jgi:hypothetical protein